MIAYYALSTFYVVTCLILLLVILLQQGKGDMAAAFGGGSSQSAFGARAGATVLSKATAILSVLFMLGAMALSIMGRGGSSSVVSGTAGTARAEASGDRTGDARCDDHAGAVRHDDSGPGHRADGCAAAEVAI